MFDFTIKPDKGKPFKVTAGSRDILAWERVAKGRTFGDLVEGHSLIDMYGLAYQAAKRQGKFDGTQAEFEATCDLTADAAAVEEPDPTQPEA